MINVERDFIIRVRLIGYDERARLRTSLDEPSDCGKKRDCSISSDVDKLVKEKIKDDLGIDGGLMKDRIVLENVIRSPAG